MSTQARQRPSSRDASLDATPDFVANAARTPSIDDLMPMLEAALGAESERSQKVGALHAFIDLLVRMEDPAKLAPALHALLDKQGVDSLVDEQGVPVSIAVTRALLSLAYPHPLEVPPERLEALRQWELLVPRAPSGWMFAVLLVATVFQALCHVMSDDIRHLFQGLSADALAGVVPAPHWTDGFVTFARLLERALPWTQFVGNVLAFLYATVIADTARERHQARQGFLWLGGLGLLMALMVPMGSYELTAAIGAAVGALLTGLMLRLPRPEGSKPSDP
ncbi:hypothetical protein [Corallococcus llansteffanensis]|uniref:Uncharacterized protein n=1 Tax=Corallococcus llansteffanensis TaxID=2316731 RepID=A0A3A8QEY2_9BACT|nr:hypothetical protein [Corallococcus llansteffanensis]RKH61784.1 hypothetical protein D7V93_11155 [Corallococcus llansteffanensis]